MKFRLFLSLLSLSVLEGSPGPWILILNVSKWDFCPLEYKSLTNNKKKILTRN